MMLRVRVLLAVATVPPSPLTAQAASQPDPAAYYPAGEAALAAQLARTENKDRARNVILFIGDGMGIATLTAGRIHEGQRKGADGESRVTEIDRLPWGGLVRTYTHDAQVADSAGTATAMITGHKTRNGVLGISGAAGRGDCGAALAAPLVTLFEQAEDKGYATGIVSTARITHVTPAAAYAHTADRDWEADSDLPATAKAAGCVDIARQLVEWPHGNGFEVMLGGGREKFLPRSEADPEYPKERGARGDGRDLIAEWTKRTRGDFVWNTDMLGRVAARTDGPLLGLFEPDHMRYEADRAGDPGGEPSLADMTRAAICRLSRNKTGFVLMVEAGRIDHAHHAGNAARALIDMVALNDAILAAREMTDAADTLLIVTADHSHTLTIAGYPERGNPILGVMKTVNDEDGKGADGKAYTTLGYMNGPGALSGARPDPTEQNTGALDYKQQALVPLKSETHAGEDVAIKASGPFAHLLSGTIEQNLIYHVMRHALGF